MYLSLVAAINNGDIYKNPKVFPSQVTFQLKTIPLTKKKNKVILTLLKYASSCIYITLQNYPINLGICTIFLPRFIYINKKTTLWVEWLAFQETSHLRLIPKNRGFNVTVETAQQSGKRCNCSNFLGSTVLTLQGFCY